MEVKNAVQAIMNRRSIRKYKPEQLTEEQLGIVLDAFNWAPTARNAQEVRAIVLQDAEMLKAFAADFGIYHRYRRQAVQEFLFRRAHPHSALRRQGIPLHRH